jgi:hypothetical protein
MEIEMRGGWGACNYPGGCLGTMDYTARFYDVDIVYRSPNYNAFFSAGEGWIPRFFENELGGIR